jgi:FlaA1/EpsC-like NDP-sugar epimerase
VLVTGAGGSIGSELVRQILRQAPRRLVLLDAAEPPLYEIEQEVEEQLARLRNEAQGPIEEPEVAAVLGSVGNERLVSGVLRKYEIAIYTPRPTSTCRSSRPIHSRAFTTTPSARSPSPKPPRSSA